MLGRINETWPQKIKTHNLFLTMSEELKVFTFEEVAAHNTTDDLWVVYNGKVYDVTKYLDEHPGGEEVVLDVAGTDATEAFNDIGHSDEAHEVLEALLVGKVEGGVIKEARIPNTTSDDSGISTPLVAVAVFAIAVGVYYYLQ